MSARSRSTPWYRSAEAEDAARRRLHVMLLMEASRAWSKSMIPFVPMEFSQKAWDDGWKELEALKLRALAVPPEYLPNPFANQYQQLPCSGALPIKNRLKERMDRAKEIRRRISTVNDVFDVDKRPLTAHGDGRIELRSMMEESEMAKKREVETRLLPGRYLLEIVSASYSNRRRVREDGIVDSNADLEVHVGFRVLASWPLQTSAGPSNSYGCAPLSVGSEAIETFGSMLGDAARLRRLLDLTVGTKLDTIAGLGLVIGHRVAATVYTVVRDRAVPFGFDPAETANDLLEGMLEKASPNGEVYVPYLNARTGRSSYNSPPSNPPRIGRDRTISVTPTQGPIVARPVPTENDRKDPRFVAIREAIAGWRVLRPGEPLERMAREADDVDAFEILTAIRRRV